MYPNPTAGAATVVFTPSVPTVVSVEVFDVLGRYVATLAEDLPAAGVVRLTVPAHKFARGIYLVRVSTEEGVGTGRLSVVR